MQSSRILFSVKYGHKRRPSTSVDDVSIPVKRELLTDGRFCFYVRSTLLFRYLHTNEKSISIDTEKYLFIDNSDILKITLPNYNKNLLLTDFTSWHIFFVWLQLFPLKKFVRRAQRSLPLYFQLQMLKDKLLKRLSCQCWCRHR